MIQTSSIRNWEGEKKKQQQLATIPCKYFFVLLGDSYLAISFIDSTEASTYQQNQMLDKMSYPILPAMSSFNALYYFVL